jgi:hypothetical protein
MSDEQIGPALARLEDKIARRKEREYLAYTGLYPGWVMPTEEQEAELRDAQQTYDELMALTDKAREIRDRVMVDLLERRVSQVQVANIAGISRTRMWQLMSRLSNPPRIREVQRGSLNEERDREIYVLRRQGVTIRALAERYGVGKTRIHQILRRQEARS